MPKVSVVPTNRTLRDIHAALSADLVRLEAQLPDDIDGLDEGFERYAQIISLLVKSMDVLMRQDAKLHEQMRSAHGARKRQNLVSEIERALDRLATTQVKKRVSRKPE